LNLIFIKLLFNLIILMDTIKLYNDGYYFGYYIEYINIEINMQLYLDSLIRINHKYITFFMNGYYDGITAKLL